MTKVAIAGADDAGRQIWEALVSCGSVDVVAFVDGNPRRVGGRFLGLDIVGYELLDRDGAPFLVVPDRDHQEGAEEHQFATPAVPPARVLSPGLARTADHLTAWAAARFPDPLAPLLASPAGPPRARLGIFGTGAAAVKVWEASTAIDEVELAWFADNDVRQQGRVFLWQPVIAPAAILATSFDGVIVGSMSRDAIRAQLCALGVREDRICTPAVVEPVERILEQLSIWIDARFAVAGA